MPVRSKTQGMCDAVVWMEPLSLAYIHNRFKTQKMYDKTVKKYRFSFLFVPHWFVRQQKVKYLGMMTMIRIIISLLSGTMVIENARPKKQK